MLETVTCRKQGNYHYKLSLVFNSSWDELISLLEMGSWSRWIFALTRKKLYRSFPSHSHSDAGQQLMPLLRDWPLSPSCGTCRQVLSRSILSAWISALTEMTDRMQNTKARSSLELRLFSSCLNTNRFLDKRSLERKKGKNPQLFLQSTSGLLCGNNKHSGSLEKLSGKR